MLIHHLNSFQHLYFQTTDYVKKTLIQNKTSLRESTPILKKRKTGNK